MFLAQFNGINDKLDSSGWSEGVVYAKRHSRQMVISATLGALSFWVRSN
ncbi:hypothetical protein [Azospirillum argentinense]